MCCVQLFHYLSLSTPLVSSSTELHWKPKKISISAPNGLQLPISAHSSPRGGETTIVSACQDLLGDMQWQTAPPFPMVHNRTNENLSAGHDSFYCCYFWISPTWKCTLMGAGQDSALYWERDPGWSLNPELRLLCFIVGLMRENNALNGCMIELYTECVFHRPHNPLTTISKAQ